MNCPSCLKDTKFSVIDSRSKYWGVRRIRKCTECGYCLATIEISKMTSEAITDLRFLQEQLDYKQKKGKKNEKI